jgi:hypothetical protein
MRTLLGCVMILNAALFFFGALQHVGIAIGRFHEPRIIPAAIVETVCGLSLAWGAIAVFSQSAVLWRTALIGNVVAVGGVLLGMAALAAGRGPRTATNDMYHHIMLALAGVALLILFFARSALNRS